jgi:hypothetical protein
MKAFKLAIAILGALTMAGLIYLPPGSYYRIASTYSRWGR